MALREQVKLAEAEGDREKLGKAKLAYDTAVGERREAEAEETKKKILSEQMQHLQGADKGLAKALQAAADADDPDKNPSKRAANEARA